MRSPNPRWHLAVAIVLALSVVVAQKGYASSASDLAASAHQSYDAGRFTEAARLYQEALRENGASGPLLYDYGNALYRLGRYPEAILAYRRALVLSPGDPDILHNLKLARGKAEKATRAEPPGVVIPYSVARALRLWMPSGRFQMLGLTCYVLFWGLVVVYRRERSQRLRRGLTWTGMVALWVGTISLLLTDGGDGRPALKPSLPEGASTPVVSIAERLVAYSGNSETFSAIYLLEPGSELLAGERRGDWIEVFLPAGYRGWVRLSEVRLVEATVDDLPPV